MKNIDQIGESSRSSKGPGSDARWKRQLNSALQQFQALIPLNQDKIWITLLDIEEKLQMTPGETVRISLPFHHTTSLIKRTQGTEGYRKDALEFLKGSQIIQAYEMDPTGLEDLLYLGTNTGGSVKLNFEPRRFHDFKNIVAQTYADDDEAEGPNEPPRPKKEVSKANPASDIPEEAIEGGVYRIKYTPRREVLLNNFLLAKVDFNSENDNIFSFLTKNPNRTISPDELTKALGGTAPKKDLHKVVENLGFRSEFKAMFFSISKTGILFRNPITQEVLDELGIKWIKFPLK